MKCAQADAFIHTYVDGELAGVDRDAYEQHLLECDACSHAGRLQARFKAAVRGHLPRLDVPKRLEQSIAAAIAAEPPIQRRWVWQAYPRAIPAVAAAAMLLIVVGVARKGRSPVLLDQTLRTLQAGVPMDVIDSNCTFIAKYFRGKTDFVVPSIGTVTCLGGRLVNVNDHFGAYLQLQTNDGRPLGMTIAHTDEDDSTGIETEPRLLNGRKCRVGRTRGATTATCRDVDGLTYVVAGDIDPASMSTFLQTAFHPAP